MESKEENATDFETDFKENKFSYTWHIKNIHLCKLKCQEFLESPPFSTRFCGKDEWTLRIYPKYKKGRKDNNCDFCELTRSDVCNCEKTGLFIHSLFNDSVNSSIRYRFVCERYLFESGTKVIFRYPKKGLAEIELDAVDTPEYGTGDLYDGDEFKKPGTLIIRCDIFVSYMGVPSNYDAGFLQSGTLSQDLNEMLENGKFSDITLQTKDVKLPAHKNILASRSKAFDAMFRHNMKETHTNVVKIEDIEPEVLTSFLQYIYTGRVKEFNIEKAISLYPAADKYFLEELKYWCAEIMQRHMTAENVCRIAVLADLHTDPHLKEAALNMFRNCANDIFKRKEWQDIVIGGSHHALVSEIQGYVSSEFITNCEDK